MNEKATRRDALVGAGAGLLAGALGPVRSAQAQQKIAVSGLIGQLNAPIQMNFAQVTKPASGVIMPDGYVRALAQFAYVWGWPLVNMVNRRAIATQAPVPGLNGGIVPIAPRGRIAMLVDYISPQENFVTCPNQDVVYGSGFFALDAEPVVFQVPDFGDRFWVYALYDSRTDQFGHLGKPYNTKPGFYLLVGPSWRGARRPESTRSCAARPSLRAPSRAFFSTTRRRIAPPSAPWSIRSSPIRWPSSMGR